VPLAIVAVERFTAPVSFESASRPWRGSSVGWGLVPRPMTRAPSALSAVTVSWMPAPAARGVVGREVPVNAASGSVAPLAPAIIVSPFGW